MAVQKSNSLNTNITNHDNAILSCAQNFPNALIVDGSESCGNGPDCGSSVPARGAAAASSNKKNNNKKRTNDDDHNITSSLFLSRSSSTEFNLCEKDAYILEQGVEEKRGADLADFDDEGRRLEASESNSSLTDFENDSVATGEEDLNSSGRSQRSGDGLILRNPIDESRNDLPTSLPASSLASPLPLSRKYADGAAPLSSNDVISMPAIDEGSSCHNTHDHAVKNSWPLSHIVDIEPVEQLETFSENKDHFIGPSPPQSPSTSQIIEIDHEALALRIASGRVQHRSDSFDRRMSESAQFAEIVGEDSLLLNKIIEEDSSSDFDDDEIDEGGKNLELHEEDQGRELLLDCMEDVQNNGGQPDVVATEQLVEASPHVKIGTKCASSQLAEISLRGEECSNQPMSQQQGGLPQLLTTLEVGIVDYAPTTPAPSPCKPNAKMLHPHSTFAKSLHPPCYVDWKLTRQHSSCSNSGGDHARRKNSVSASPSGETNFFYRGIRANPPEITKRGMARGNYAQLHRKAWLEVSDKHHRYGKNLRMYYKHWEALGHPFRMFFDWLDSKGEAMGNPLPNLPEISRLVLDSDTVLYITNPEISASYALGIVANPADGSGIILDQNGNPINTGKEGWIFILRDHVLYGSQKVTTVSTPSAGALNGASPAAMAASKPRQRFHHSSFFGGKAVASAGIFLTNEQGRLTHLYPHSGHYRPGEAHMQRALFFFQQLGVELSTFSVDMQQIFKVSRKFAPKGGDAAAAGGEKAEGKKEKYKEYYATINNGKYQQINGEGKHAPPPQNMKKSKKTECLHLMRGLEVACFLAHKAIMIEKGVFHQIHKIRRIPRESRSSVCFIRSSLKKVIP